MWFNVYWNDYFYKVGDYYKDVCFGYLIQYKQFRLDWWYKDSLRCLDIDVDVKDVPENVQEMVRKKIQDPFSEIELERYIRQRF
jgi:hypothetical protein